MGAARKVPDLWVCWRSLPEDNRKRADQAYEHLKQDPQYPSLHFKKVGHFWSARVGGAGRAVAVEGADGFIRFGIGTHADYEKLHANPLQREPTTLIMPPPAPRRGSSNRESEAPHICIESPMGHHFRSPPSLPWHRSRSIHDSPFPRRRVARSPNSRISKTGQRIIETERSKHAAAPLIDSDRVRMARRRKPGLAGIGTAFVLVHFRTNFL